MTATPVCPTARAGRGLSRPEWTRLWAMAAVILGLHALGWGTLVLVVAPHHYGAGTSTIGLGVGLTAYTLGLRHAFDADHISAIDNTTRKLMSEGQRPMSVGFFFSLGHASVVFALTFLLSVGVKSIVGPVTNHNSALHHYTGLVGTSISGTFLYVIALLNALVLVGVFRTFRDMRSGRFDESALDEQLAARGVMNRVFGRVASSVSKPWQIYPVGVLFGLGFDTASEVALLVLAGSSAVAGLPWYTVLCLPVLFAAGMTLFDTIDGSFMNFAYGWAFAKPARKIFYNLAITGLSVVTAFTIGTVELLGVLAAQMRWDGGWWHWIRSLDLNVLGFFIVGLFVAAWLGAVLIWRIGRFEQRWSPEQAGQRPTELELARAS